MMKLAFGALSLPPDNAELLIRKVDKPKQVPLHDRHSPCVRRGSDQEG